MPNENEQVDLDFREEKTQKYSKRICLMCYGHEPTKGSHCPKYRLGARTENSLCPHSSLCYQNRAKEKTKNLLNLVGFVGSPVFDGLQYWSGLSCPTPGELLDQGPNPHLLLQPWPYSFLNLEPVFCSMSGFNCCFLTCIQISQEVGKLIWYSHLFKNFPQFVVGLIVGLIIILIKIYSSDLNFFNMYVKLKFTYVGVSVI